MYEVVDSKVYSALCCYDFGNASTTGNPDGASTMETIYYGNATLFGSGGGKGPWLMSDLEAGTYPLNLQKDSNIPSLSYPKFATLMLKGHSGDRFALKAGDAQTGLLQTTWDGKRPKGYSPMHKQGAIVLGTGGDGSFLGSGVFFEGAITIGCPDDKAVDDAIQADIVAAGYGK
jgi:non-reducing end alpha-L-arabinofuranosidase